MKDHEIAALVNEVTKIAREFGQTEQLRERLAHLLVPVLKSERPDPCPDIKGYVSGGGLDHVMNKVRAGAVPNGWKLVPVEPTREMLDAYVAQDARFQSARTDWHAMLNAAPRAPAVESPASTEFPDYQAGWKAGYKHGAWGEKRQGLTRQQLREAFYRHTGCTLGGDIELAEHVCTVVEREHGIGITPADAKDL